MSGLVKNVILSVFPCELRQYAHDTSKIFQLNATQAEIARFIAANVRITCAALAAIGISAAMFGILLGLGTGAAGFFAGGGLLITATICLSIIDIRISKLTSVATSIGNIGVVISFLPQALSSAEQIFGSLMILGSVMNLVQSYARSSLFLGWSLKKQHATFEKFNCPLLIRWSEASLMELRPLRTSEWARNMDFAVARILATYARAVLSHRGIVAPLIDEISWHLGGILSRRVMCFKPRPLQPNLPPVILNPPIAIPAG